MSSTLDIRDSFESGNGALADRLAATADGPDIEVLDCGTLFLVTAVSENGELWIEEHIDTDAMRWGSGVVVEHRFVLGVVAGMESDGLLVR